MAICIRAKRVTDPLDERVRARLRGEVTGNVSSEYDADVRGSDGGGGCGGGEDPSCFSNLLHAFLNPIISLTDPDVAGDSDSDGTVDGGDAVKHAAAMASAKLRELLDPPAQQDPSRVRLLSEVQSAAEASGLGPNGLVSRRDVMTRLRERGFNAAICKAQWKGGGGITAGSYEYIDVVFAASESTAAEGERRYIVDMGFAAEFEVARATEEYWRVVKALPEVVVAQMEEVKEAVRVVAEAARWSMKSRGLTVPPWRKRRYMMAKWLGPYRRSVNPISAASPSCGETGGEVRCRAVGFGSAGGVGTLPAGSMN